MVLYTNHDVDFSRGDIRLERQRPVEGVVNVIDSGAYQNFNIMQALGALTCLHYLFTLRSYCYLEGHVLAEMAGQLNWLELQGEIISSKETSRWP